MSTRRHYDWVGIVARLRSRPGRWVLEFPHEPVRLAKRIRLRQHPDLRLPDGRVEVDVVNQYTEPGLPPKGDIWVRFVPTPPDQEEP